MNLIEILEVADRRPANMVPVNRYDIFTRLIVVSWNNSSIRTVHFIFKEFQCTIPCTTVFIFFNVKPIMFELILYKLKTWFLQCVIEVSKCLSQIQLVIATYILCTSWYNSLASQIADIRVVYVFFTLLTQQYPFHK